MVREENYEGRKNALLQVVCVGMEVIAIIILLLYFLNKFMPVFFIKLNIPGMVF